MEFDDFHEKAPHFQIGLYRHELRSPAYYNFLVERSELFFKIGYQCHYKYTHSIEYIERTEISNRNEVQFDRFNQYGDEICNWCTPIVGCSIHRRIYIYLTSNGMNIEAIGERARATRIWSMKIQRKKWRLSTVLMWGIIVDPTYAE